MAIEKDISIYGVDMKLQISEDAFYAKRLLQKRTEYIYKMHNKMRDFMNVLFAIYAADNLSTSFGRTGGVRSAFILCFMDKYEYVDKRVVEKFMYDTKRFSKLPKSLWTRLESEGYIFKIMDEPNPVLYSVTTKGRDMYKNTCKVFANEVFDFMAGRVPEKTRLPVKREQKTGEVFGKKTKEHVKEIMRNNYRLMMQPYWDAGLKRVPKNLKVRYDILFDYIMHKKENGEEIPEFLTKLLIKWQPSEDYQYYQNLQKGKKKLRNKKAPKNTFGANKKVDNDSALLEC